MKTVFMKCGHAANAATGAGKPYCVICDCGEVAENRPSLEGRKAHCSDCGRETGSDWSLPFFEYRPAGTIDRYYCGCWGWN